MTTTALFLVLAAFLASAVEMVEALTIVLAMGVTRGWRSALIGVAVAFAALAAIVGLAGPLLLLIPIAILRVVVGGLLLIFGLQWLRKAILRASGFKALRDEAALYQQELAESRHAATEIRAGMDWYAFTLCFKGVFLEGLEVAFIVLTFGSSHGSISLAAFGALVAFVLVAIVGVLVHAPLSRVPENAMKFAVGVMLTTFGIFWGAEGVGVAWPGETISLLGVLVFVVALSFGLVAVLRGQHQVPAPAVEA